MRLGYLIMALLFSNFAQTKDLDPASTEALKKTQELLQTTELRDKAVAESSNAQFIDAQVRSLVGNGANKEQIYQISSQILAELVKSTGGDASKMSQILIHGKNNPKEFLESLSPESQKAI